jgi:hypothetical protein
MIKIQGADLLKLPDHIPSGAVFADIEQGRVVQRVSKDRLARAGLNCTSDLACPLPHHLCPMGELRVARIIISCDIYS